MRLLIFLYSLGGGGAERVTATLANRWAANGHRVSVLTLAPVDEDAYALHPDIERLSLRQAKASSGLITGAFRTLRRLLALRRVLRDRQPDVALSMMPVANTLLAVATLGMRVDLVASERSYPPELPLRWMWRLLRKWSYARFDAIVAPTAEIMQWLLEHTRARRVIVIPNPVALPLPSVPPIVAPSSVGTTGRARLLAVGRLSEEKRFANLIGVFGRLTPEYPEWELVLLGDGPERAGLRHTIEGLGLSDTVFLVGHVGNLGDWYHSAALFALTSRFEGFPNALVEALAHGVPCVSVDCRTGPRDIIRPEVDGILVPPNDDAALGRALARLMGDATLRTHMAARASDARERFALGAIGASWDVVLNGDRR